MVVQTAIWDEYISRDAVMDMLSNQHRKANSMEAIVLIDDIRHAALVIPAADVVEVQHSHWFFTEYEYFTCANCGHDVKSGAESTRAAKEMLKKGLYDNYCPNCGAKMDGKRKDGAE